MATQEYDDLLRYTSLQIERDFRDAEGLRACLVAAFSDATGEKIWPPERPHPRTSEVVEALLRHGGLSDFLDRWQTEHTNSRPKIAALRAWWEAHGFQRPVQVLGTEASPDPAGGQRLPPSFRRFATDDLRNLLLTLAAVGLFGFAGAMGVPPLLSLFVARQPDIAERIVAAQATGLLVLLGVYATWGRLPAGPSAPNVVERVREVAVRREKVPLRQAWLACAASAMESFGQFRLSVLSLLASWTTLYIVLAVAPWLPPTAKSAVDAVTSLLNNLGSLFMFAAYVVMTFVTTLPVGSAQEPAGERRAALALVIAPAFCIGVLFIGDLAMSLFGALPGAHAVYAIASGLGAALALAMWVGRFDSKFIDANTGFLMVLYGYAAIQPLWIFIEETSLLTGPITEAIRPFLLGFAGVCKVVLILFVIWLTQSGRILFYFARIRDLSDHILDSWLAANDGTRSASTAPPKLAWQTVVTGALAQLTLVVGVVLTARALGDSPHIPGVASKGTGPGLYGAEIVWDLPLVQRHGVIPTCDSSQASQARSVGRLGLGESRGGVSYWLFYSEWCDDADGCRAPKGGCDDSAVVGVKLGQAKADGDHTTIDLITEWRRRHASGAASAPPEGVASPFPKGAANSSWQIRVPGSWPPGGPVNGAMLGPLRPDGTRVQYGTVTMTPDEGLEPINLSTAYPPPME